MGKTRDTRPPRAGEMLAAALAYAARDWSVIPIERGGTRPLVPRLEFRQRVATADEIDGWLRRWPDANVGIVTGPVSGLVVFDNNPRHDGTTSLERLRAEHGSPSSRARATARWRSWPGTCCGTAAACDAGGEGLDERR